MRNVYCNGYYLEKYINDTIVGSVNFLLDLDIADAFGSFDESNSDINFYDVTFFDVSIAAYGIGIFVQNGYCDNCVITFDTIVIEQVSNTGDSNALVYELSSADNINTNVEFVDCEFTNNINMSIVRCISDSFCNITFKNCLFNNNIYYYTDNNISTLLYNAIFMENGSNGEIVIQDSIFVGDYTSQVGGANESFIYDETQNSTFKCINCIFYDTLPPTYAPSNNPSTIPTALPSFVPSTEPTIIPTFPTDAPSTIPTSLPTTIPTEQSQNSQKYGFIDNSDIEFETLKSESANEDMSFNPGFRNVLYSKIKIELTSQASANLFKDWYYGDIDQSILSLVELLPDWGVVFLCFSLFFGLFALETAFLVCLVCDMCRFDHFVDSFG